MDPDGQLRNLRDFLLVYNRMTEICFQRCSSNFNYRNLTMDEESCVDSCAGKLIRSNHRLMGTYVQLMPRMVQRRMEELESKAAANEKAAETAALASVTPPSPETLPESPSPLASSPPLPGLSPQQLPSLTDVRPEAFGSVSTPESDIPLGIDVVAPRASTATEVKLSAAAPLTPLAEAVNLPVLNEVGSGPSTTTGFPPQPPPDAHAVSESSAAVLMPFKPTPLSVDVPLSTVAAPVGSISTDIPLSVQERPSEVPPQTGQ